jgi:predicted ATP-grasp superfamily ATP-dependent carboligase
MKPRASKGIGAVVIGGDYQGLGIVRSLGRQGVPVHVIDDEHSIARFSRYASSALRVPDLRTPESTLKALLQLGRLNELNGCVLYPTRDETVAVLSQQRSQLSQYFRVPTPGWETIRWIWDKRNTYQMAEKLDIPTPRTWLFHKERDLADIDGHLPVAIKPAIKEHFVHATGDKCWRADAPWQLRRLFTRAQRYVPADEIMLQDIIPGDGDHQFAYCAFFKEGRAVASIVVQRRRQHPLEFGRASTYVESVDVPELERLSVRFLSAIDYYGLVEVEFKRDPRNGKFCLLDVNGRTWGYHTIGRPAGVDFPALLLSDQVGGTVEPCRGRSGVRWIRLLTDVPTGAVGVLKGVFGPGSYLSSLCNWDEEAVFSTDDPLPGVAELALVPYLFFTRGAALQHLCHRVSRLASRAPARRSLPQGNLGESDPVRRAS